MVAEIDSLVIVQPMELDATCSLMVWHSITIMDCDQLADQNPVTYAHFVIVTHVTFSFDQNLSHLGSTFVPIWSNIELRVMKYYE